MQTSNGHPLDLNDNADQPRCPMEAAVDRAKTLKRPEWLFQDALWWSDGTGSFEFRMNINRVDQLDDLIAFLQEVRG